MILCAIHQKVEELCLGLKRLPSSLHGVLLCVVLQGENQEEFQPSLKPL